MDYFKCREEIEYRHKREVDALINDFIKNETDLTEIISEFRPGNIVQNEHRQPVIFSSIAVGEDRLTYSSFPITEDVLNSLNYTYCPARPPVVLPVYFYNQATRPWVRSSIYAAFQGKIEWIHQLQNFHFLANGEEIDRNTISRIIRQFQVIIESKQ